MLAVFILILVCTMWKVGFVLDVRSTPISWTNLVPISGHYDMCKNSLAKEPFRLLIFFFGFLVVEQISWFGLFLAPCFKKEKLVANVPRVSLLFHLLPVVLVM
jgi:hypothetical protein